MLIINADDWGKNQKTTDNSLECYKNNRISSASAMVFMADSARAAELATEHNFDTGLHINFNLNFDGNLVSSRLKLYHQAIASFLSRNKYNVLIYNPLLKKEFEYVFQAQYDEFIRLFCKTPTHFDGHRHLHLCMNMVIDSIIPQGMRIRKNFTFFKGEKSSINIRYRTILDHWLMKRYLCTDYFFDLAPFNDSSRLQQIINLSRSFSVELMVHPERTEEFRYLISEDFQQLIRQTSTCDYTQF